MTVAEYIIKLQALPQDLEIVAMDGGCGCCSSGDFEDPDEPVVVEEERYMWDEESKQFKNVKLRNAVRIA